MDLANNPQLNPATAIDQELFLIVADEQRLHSLNVNLKVPQELTFGDEGTDYVLPGVEGSHEAKIFGGKIFFEGQELAIGEPQEIAGMQVSLVARQEPAYYDLAGVEQFFIGHDTTNDIVLANSSVDIMIRRINEHYELTRLDGHFYINHRMFGNNDSDVTTSLFAGDQLNIAGAEVTLESTYLRVNDEGSLSAVHLSPLPDAVVDRTSGYPDYHRSPRIIYRVPQAKVTLSAPTQVPESPDAHLGRVLLPPLVMVAASVAMSLLSSGNPAMMLSMGAMSLMTVVTSISAYFKGKHDYRDKIAQRLVDYDELLTHKSVELNTLRQQQLDALHYHYPSLSTINSMIERVDSRIYEKTPLQHDFLSFRVGLGTIPASYSINFEDEPMSKDSLLAKGRALYAHFQQIDNAPITADLMHGPVGIIGPRTLTIEAVQSMMLQLATFQSYRDLQFVSVFPEAELPKWNWLRWLPHNTIQSMNVRGFVYHDRSRDQILTSLYQIIKDRDQAAKESQSSQERTLFSPHYVVLLTHEELVLDHPIMEYFSKDLTALGVSLVFVEDVLQSLPEQVQTVIDIGTREHGRVIIREGKLLNQDFVPDHFDPALNWDYSARGLAALNHLETLQNSIPKRLNFLQLYGAERVEDLDVAGRWNTSEPFKSLEVRIGKRGADDYVTLNLHESADGPHGLVAGTTGSGKSVLLAAVTLSLALVFKPTDIAFLIIDYKGGGLANELDDLPHMLGAITNLDGAQSLRALESIRAELNKRQRLFREFGVNHINQYQRLYNDGTAKEPMPHLVIISDEFAELKSNQPDFMDELVSIARIGRSLGVHLILATQQPAGVVDDQIWSNSNFRIALRMQNAADSNEVLHTPDAASIPVSDRGRAYMQVGNNDKYELFQSPFAGAVYDPDHKKQTSNQKIFLINELGQYNILTQDLSGEANIAVSETKDQLTEQDAIIEYIKKYSEEVHMPILSSPWLPPLAKKIDIPAEQQIHYQTAWNEPFDSQIQIGIVDIPSRQAQEPLKFDFRKNGHTAVIGSAGYGKSTFLQTVLLQLARQNNAEQLHLYLFDLGTNGLLPLRDLPQVADLIRADEGEKLAKGLARLEGEIKRRKRLLNHAGVATVEQYATATGTTLPYIVVAIDNYDAVRDSDFEDAFEATMVTVAREGASVGLYLLISANRMGAFRMQFVSSLKTKMSLYIFDQTDLPDIVGRTKLKIDDVPGRGIIKLDQPEIFQTFEPAQGDNSVEVLTAIRNEAKQMVADWDGEIPDAIPMVPEEFDFDEFAMMPAIQSLPATRVPFGLQLDDTRPAVFDLKRDGMFLMLPETDEQQDNYVGAMIAGMSDKTEEYRTLVFGNPGDQQNFGDRVTRVFTEDDYDRNLQNLLLEIRNRKEDKEHDDLDYIVVIRDLSDLIGRATLDATDAQDIFVEGPKLGVHVIVGIGRSELETSFDPTITVVKQELKVGIMGARLGDQNLLQHPYIANEGFLTDTEAYYFKGRSVAKVRMPKAAEAQEEY